MMDRDFPPTRRQQRLTVVSLAVAGVIGVLLFGGFLPGLHPNFSPGPTTTFDGKTYYWTTLSVPTVWLGGSRTPPTFEAFHNVTFWTWLTNWSLLGGAYLHGNATEPNGTVYSFTVGGPPAASNRTTDYVSPGGAVVIKWEVSTTAELLVLA